MDVFVTDGSGVVHVVLDHQPSAHEGHYVTVCGEVISERRPLMDTLSGLLCRRCAERR